MAEYIDKEKLLLSIHKAYCEECDKAGAWCRACWVDDMRLEIASAPTEDVVGVVRCKDCKYRLDRMCDCNQWANDDFATYVDENDFCSYGKKMDGKDGKI